MAQIPGHVDRLLPLVRSMLHQPVIGDPGEHAAVKETFRPGRVEVAGGPGGDDLVGGLAGVEQGAGGREG